MIELNDNIKLVKADTNDLAAIKQILNNCNLPAGDITEQHLEHFYILKKGSVLLGSVGLEIYDDHGLLRSLATAKPVRGNGFGKLLVKQIEQYGRQQNLFDLYLLTTTAEGFFNSLKYRKVSRTDIPREVKRSEEFSSICPDSAVSMVKEL